MHHTKDKGDIGLTIIIADLVREGWFVSLPLQEHSPYDLIATKGSTIRRIQVKYRTEDKHGALEVTLRNSWGNSKKGAVRSARYSATDVDTIAVTNGDKIGYLDMKEVGHQDTFKIRIRPSKNNQFKKCRTIEEFAILT